MRPTRRLATAVIASFTIIALGSAARPAPAPHTAAAETRRIRAHFDSVLAELAASPAAPREGPQAVRRASLIRELRRYRDRGVFPHNYDFPGRDVPYFVDRETGTLCAVANLLAVSGRRDIVDRVARADNNVLVARLAGDTAFTRWLSASGLTLAEAARIQMPYRVTESPAQRARNDVFYVVAPLSVGTSFASSVWNATANADGHRRAANVIGLVSSALTLVVGASTAGKTSVSPIVAPTSLAIGALGMALSTRGMMRHLQRTAAQPPEPRESTAAREVSVAPVISRNGGAGMSLALRF